MRSNAKNPARALASAAVVALWAGSALAADKVVVQPFQAKGIDTSVASILESSLCTALMDEGIETMCPEDLRALIVHKQFQAGLGSCGEGDSECLKNLAQLTESNRVVSGEVSRLGDVFLIKATLLDTESNKVLARAEEKAKKPEELLDRVKPLAKKLKK